MRRTCRTIVSVALVAAGVGVARGQTFTPGDVFWASNVTVSESINVTGGGDFSAAVPFATTGRPPGQYAWNHALDTAYLAQFDADSVVSISATGTVTTFATGINGPAGLLFTQDGRLLVVSALGGVVVDISAGGDFSGATPFASGLTVPRNLLQLSSGEILVAEQNAGEVTDITAGGSFSGAAPFASGLSLIADLVQTAAGTIYVGQFNADQVMDITAGGNFSSATPFATGHPFMGLAIDGDGRLLADELNGQRIWDITAGGDFSAAAAWAFNLPGQGEAAMDSVPTPQVSVPTSSMWGLAATVLAMLTALTVLALRARTRRQTL